MPRHLGEGGSQRIRVERNTRSSRAPSPRPALEDTPLAHDFASNKYIYAVNSDSSDGDVELRDTEPPAWEKEAIPNIPSLIFENPRIRFGDVGRTATFTEAFFDLVYVLVLQQLFAFVGLSSSGIADYIWFFAIAWHSWNGEIFFNTRFDTDDAISRLLTVASMLGVVGLSHGIQVYRHDVNTGAVRYVMAYMLIRTVLVLNYVRAWITLPVTRKVSGAFILLFGSAVVLWGIGIGVQDLPSRHAVWAVAMSVDYLTPFCMLSFMVPFHPTHMAERNGVFAILTMAGVVFNFNGFVFDGDVTARRVACVLCGLCIPYLLMLLYSTQAGPHMIGFTNSLLAKLRAYLWIYSHMPLTLTITLLAISLGHTDCMSCGVREFGAGTVGLGVSSGLALILLAFIHMLGVNSSSVKIQVRAVIRLAAGVVLVVVATALKGRVSCYGMLVLILSTFAIQALFDSTKLMVQETFDK